MVQSSCEVFRRVLMVKMVMNKMVVGMVVFKGHSRERRRVGLDFLHTQAMESTPNYRGWKRAILSILGKTFWPLIWLGRIPTIGSK